MDVLLDKLPSLIRLDESGNVVLEVVLDSFNVVVGDLLMVLDFLGFLGGELLLRVEGSKTSEIKRSERRESRRVVSVESRNKSNEVFDLNSQTVADQAVLAEVCRQRGKLRAVATINGRNCGQFRKIHCV